MSQQCDHCSTVASVLKRFSAEIAQARITEATVSKARRHESGFHRWVENVLNKDDEHKFTADEVVKALQKGQ